MAENTLRSRGRPSNYKFDRGGNPAESGPYIGIVVNNVDDTRTGRVQVWIAEFGASNADGTPNLTDDSTWRTVSYCPPFYGTTPVTQAAGSGYGTYPGNRNSYGMWFTPPDLGVQVICFFIGGDPSAGYYVGCIPEPGLTHMVPAIGAEPNYVKNNTSAQNSYFEGAPQLPVTEINDQNVAVSEDPRFYDQPKPIQSVQAAVFLQQGLIKDTIRGPIGSTSVRESPSSVYGISTPGRAVYKGGFTQDNIAAQPGVLNNASLDSVQVIAREGGHTFVMDDGDLQGKDRLVRIRTAKGHQITMSDDGDAFFITHANGQTWIELGKQGTVDIYSTNSINLRTQGQLNFHADAGINMYSGTAIKMKAADTLALEAEKSLLAHSKSSLFINGEQTVGIKSSGLLGLDSISGGWNAKGQLSLKAGRINLNSGAAPAIPSIPPFGENQLPDVVFQQGIGWNVENGKLKTIVTRAPTHMPYPFANKGVDVSVNLNPVTPTVTTPTETTTITTTTGGQTTLDQYQTTTAAQAREKYLSLNAVPVQNAIKLEDVIVEPQVSDSAGQLDGNDLQAMNAQTAKEVAAEQAIEYNPARFPPRDQDGNLNAGWAVNEETGEDYYIGEKISATGVGTYGQSVPALVSTGFVKGSALGLITSPSMVSPVLNSNAVWTGLLGIVSLVSYLGAKTTQNNTQNQLVSGAYAGLLDAGVLDGTEAPEYQAAFIQPASRYGVESVVSWVKGTADSDLETKIKICARQGQYAVTFSQTYQEILADTTQAYANTINRTLIDQAVTEIIGTSKIPGIQYADTIPTVTPPKITREDGTFYFAPGQPKG